MDELICTECAASVALVERGGNFVVVDYANREAANPARHTC